MIDEKCHNYDLFLNMCVYIYYPLKPIIMALITFILIPSYLISLSNRTTNQTKY